MIDITKFIPSLNSTCKSFSDLIIGQGLSCADALALVSLNSSFPSVHDVECGIMDLLFNAPKERMDIVLKSLYDDLDRIVWSYDNFFMIYDDRDLRDLWHTSLSHLKKDIEVQLKKTQEAHDEYKEASNSFEMTPFNGMSKEEASVLERRLERCKNEYQDEKTKLQNLYTKRKGGVYRRIFSGSYI